jgi:hypothetical protein
VYYNNICGNSCVNNTIAVNGVCTACVPPCLSCAVTVNTCLSCVSPYYLNTNANICVLANQCPTYTYPNISLSVCASCVSPCLACTSVSSCSSCIHGYYYYSITTLCLDVCPLGYIGIVNVCVPCQSPCK